MKKKVLLGKLEEAYTIEDVPVLVLIDEINEIIEKAGFNSKTQKELLVNLDHIKRESVNHSKIFQDLIKKVESSKKDEY